MTNHPLAFFGCAGWNIPKPYSDRFPPEGSHLERYAQVFSGVEINSSFYRSHKPATYARWSASVPPGFRFSVKVPRTITHVRRLKGVDNELDAFLGEASALGPNLGPLLVQLPPGLAFDPEVTAAFFDSLRSRFEGHIVCEPRHPSWFEVAPTDLMADFKVARVAADPAIVPAAAEPAAATDLVYYRLHGSPRIYYSAYTDQFLQATSQKMSEMLTSGAEVWCIFDNTAEGAATGDALTTMDKMSPRLG